MIHRADRGSAPGTGPWRWSALAMFAVGYGANHFVPLLTVYRRTLALSDAQATAIFGVYALGLIPGFLVGGPASDRYGRRRIMIAFTALSLVATTVLIAGRTGTAGLYAGRLLTGVVSGTVFTVGTAWVKELSGGGSGIAARRAAVALTAGFGVGPLVAGVLAQWAPLPTVLPYLVHLALGGTALALLPRAPETRPPSPGGRFQILPPAARTARFRGVVAPMAPFVFGSVSLAFTTIPAHGTRPPPTLAVAATGVLAALALTAGLAGQRWGRQLQGSVADPQDVRPAVVGLAVVAGGYLATALATARPGLGTGALAGLLLGCGYGICLVVGLREVERLASADQLGGLVAVYYSLTYLGLVIPYSLALAGPHVGYPRALLIVAALTALTLLAVLVNGRRQPRS
ncbi:MFS transporter [Modestobacter excelsi]|uniref:MFS transporter n=1 Tax=Modestobacter excelsi TaxID=2213161 RepID=UPI001C20D77B|nr:MFS transporter [Modestobacter excelsi]